MHEYVKRIVAAIVILSATAAQSMADGKMFWGEKIPPRIPYQRALILFDEGIETLILQSRYEIREWDQKPTLGWVVPVPAVPEVASMPAELARYMFNDLSRNSRPRVTIIRNTVFDVLFLMVAGVSMLTLFLCLLSFDLPLPQRLRENRGRLALYSMLGLLICFLRSNIGSSRGLLGVDVITEQKVGIYDVSVVRSDATDELIAWLNKHDFKFGDADTATFNSYVSRGWCFVVAVINPGSGEDERRIVREGLADPLILRFPHTSPIYPVALTGTGGFDTEILVYIASSAKMTTNDRLTLRFAGEMNKRHLYNLLLDTDPEGFFDAEKMNYPYLCKFKDRLTPDEMRTDIIFSKAADEEPYREHIIKW